MSKSQVSETCSVCNPKIPSFSEVRIKPDLDEGFQVGKLASNSMVQGKFKTGDDNWCIFHLQDLGGANLKDSLLNCLVQAISSSVNAHASSPSTNSPGTSVRHNCSRRYQQPRDKHILFAHCAEIDA